MKKLFFTFCTIICLGPLVAQTNFRSLTYDEAIMAAKAEKKLVFMDFYTSWCGPCKMMMREVFPQQKVGDFLNERFVCIKLDAEKEGRDLAKHYKVKAYPTFVGVDADGKEVMRRVGMALADDFINMIEQQIDPEKSPERLAQRYESGERTAGLISAYAALKVTQCNESRGKEPGKRQEAFDMVREYFDGLKDADRLTAENLFIYLNYTESPTDDIARYLITHRNEFAPEVKVRVTERIEQLYDQQIGNYLTCTTPYDVQAYREVKRGLTDLGLNKDERYTAALKLIESHATGDLDAYMGVCEKNYPYLAADQQYHLMIRFASVIDTQDEGIRKRASRFVRQLLPEMEANQLMWVAMELVKIEKGEKH